MKLLFSTILIIGLSAFSSCSEKTTPITETQPTENTDEQTTEPVLNQITLTGSFRSVAGVMNELSCYCSNGGYVTAEDRVVTAVCFDEEVASCEKITVTGYMTSRSIESNGPCPGGIMGFLKAQSYIVGETDY
ncbi:MAG: hypothetical protein P8P74_00710 [Crocinitomicaceae bacterium]|nr:hypothetical protein [Crocinitomicaceae bacterium]